MFGNSLGGRGAQRFKKARGEQQPGRPDWQPAGRFRITAFEMLEHRAMLTGTTIAAAAPLAAVYSGGANLDTSASAEVSEVVSDGTQTVNLSGYYNLTGITTNGRPFWGGLDGQGNAFSETQVGRSITWDGLTFPIGAPNVNDVVQGGGPAINLPAGNDSSVAILATGTNGNQPNQRFTINYTTGSPTYATQSISDWHVPQNYAGESIALITSYRNTSTGGRDTNGPFDVYGYSIPVDPTRTVASITLPNDSHVKVLSMIAVESVAPPTDLTATPASTTTADLYWTPATGTITGYNVFRGTTAGGESTTPINSSPLSANADSYVDTTGVPGNTYFYVVKAINGAAVSPASNEFKVTLPASGPATQVDLSGEYNLVGITANGARFSGGGLDGNGNALSAKLLGTSLTWNGTTFTIAPAGSNNVIQASDQPIGLPQGEYSKVELLATGTNGDQPNQTFTINYTTGSPTVVTQSISDWHVPHRYLGESIALTMPYRNTSTGGKDYNSPFDVYGYSIPVDPTRTISSITLPNDTNVKILAITAVT